MNVGSHRKVSEHSAPQFAVYGAVEPQTDQSVVVGPYPTTNHPEWAHDN